MPCERTQNRHQTCLCVSLSAAGFASALWHIYIYEPSRHSLQPVHYTRFSLHSRNTYSTMTWAFLFSKNKMYWFYVAVGFCCALFPPNLESNGKPKAARLMTWERIQNRVRHHMSFLVCCPNSLVRIAVAIKSLQRWELLVQHIHFPAIQIPTEKSLMSALLLQNFDLDEALLPCGLALHFDSFWLNGMLRKVKIPKIMS
jgi:hypothetical protein